MTHHPVLPSATARRAAYPAAHPAARRTALGLTLAAALIAAPVLAQVQDPLQEIKRVLLTRPNVDVLLPKNVQDEQLKKFYAEREEKLTKLIESLHTFSELRQGLILKDWGDVVKEQGFDPGVIVSDARLRYKLAQRLRAKIRQVVDKGDDNAKAAVACLITEMGLTVRAAIDPNKKAKPDELESERRAGFSRSLTDEVIKLTNASNEFVRLNALRALGGMNADPRRAAPVLAARLKPGNDTPTRRVAAEGILGLINIPRYMEALQLKNPAVSATPQDVIESGIEVVRVAPGGLGDSDAVVRLKCAEAVHGSAQGLATLFQRTTEDTKFITPIPRKELSPAEIAAVKELLKVFEAAGPKLAPSLADSNAEVRLALVQALERLSIARYRLAEEPVVVGALGKGVDRVFLLPPNASDPLSSFAKDWGAVAQLLGDSDPAVRRATVTFFEFFPEARPGVVPALTNALCDSDNFVRWGAARALGTFSKNYQPKDAVPAVTALAKQLFDPDFTSRLAAAATLESLGEYAEGAVPALAKAVKFGDVENRVAVLYVIQSIGPQRSKSLVPSVTEALEHPDPRVRRTAAETLGRYGALARNPATIEALRRALGDEDQEVRINASEALLQATTEPRER
jgi:HEAT repeat protein